MTRVFITGDRSGHGPYAALVAVEMLRATSHGMGIATGDGGGAGVEAIVRQLGAMAGMDIEVVQGGDSLDLRHALVGAREDVAEIVAVHVAPMESGVVASLFRTVPDDRVRLVSMADLLA